MSAEATENPLQLVEALTFDVFGTCVDWRATVEEALRDAAAAKLRAPASGSVPVDLLARARSLGDADWAAFAQEWRNSYGRFTRGFVPGQTEWKDIDTHHRDSLIELLREWKLEGLYTPSEVEDLSKVWHFLGSWPDTSEGVHKLGTKLITTTLSNGNRSLLEDLDKHGNLGFRRVISAEDFRAYKPNRAVYLGACEKLGLEPGKVAMVAAHLNDLAAARSFGLRTVYVERPEEEAWDRQGELYRDAQQWVDLWVREGEGGFVEVAKKLGIV